MSEPDRRQLPGSPVPAARPPRPGGIAAGRIFGVPLVVSRMWFVVVIFAMLAVPTTLRQHVVGLSETASVFAALALVVALYAAVLAHEASHVLVARALGLRVGRVVLQLFGAQSEILDEAQTPADAYAVAAVGPMTSVLLAGLGGAVGMAFPNNSLGWVLGMAFAWLNGSLAVFNLLPGMPLDGGQMLRAGLWRVTHDKLRALLVAGWVGRGIAIGSLFGGLLAFSLTTSNSTPEHVTSDWLTGLLYLFLICAFIWLNASNSINQAKTSTVLPNVAISSLLRPALTVDAQLPLAEAVRRAREIGARALVVVDARERWSGIVSEAAVQATPVERQPWVSVSDLARPVEAGLVLSPTLYGEALVTAMQQTPASEYLVADADGLLQGVLASADLMAALRAAGVH